jgi:hypothetical protein
MLKNILKLEGVQQLTKNEQKNVSGGTMVTCSCSGHAGTWTGNYRNAGQVKNALREYCENGRGSCRNA